jgi:hypothetical protein
MAEGEPAVTQEIPGIQLHAQFGRHDADPATRRVGELDAREYRAGTVKVPGEVHIVEADCQTGAVGDELFEGGALFGNTHRNNAREGVSQRDDEQQTGHDRDRTLHPV